MRDRVSPLEEADVAMAHSDEDVEGDQQYVIQYDADRNSLQEEDQSAFLVRVREEFQHSIGPEERALLENKIYLVNQSESQIHIQNLQRPGTAAGTSVSLGRFCYLVGAFSTKATFWSNLVC